VTPRGQDNTPWAPSVRQTPRRKKRRNYPLGNLGCTPEKITAVSVEGKGLQTSNSKHKHVKGHAPTRAPHYTPEACEGRPGATKWRATWKRASDHGMGYPWRGRVNSGTPSGEGVARTRRSSPRCALREVGSALGERGAHATDRSSRPGRTQTAPRVDARLAGDYPQGARLGPRVPGAVEERSIATGSQPGLRPSRRRAASASRDPSGRDSTR
jgi:hypothetical protein